MNKVNYAKFKDLKDITFGDGVSVVMDDPRASILLRVSYDPWNLPDVIVTNDNVYMLSGYNPQLRMYSAAQCTKYITHGGYSGRVYDLGSNSSKEYICKPVALLSDIRDISFADRKEELFYLSDLKEISMVLDMSVNDDGEVTDTAVDGSDIDIRSLLLGSELKVSFFGLRSDIFSDLYGLLRLRNIVEFLK